MIDNNAADILTLIAGWCAIIIEMIGIGVITFIALYATSKALMRTLRREEKADIFHELRLRLGRGILLGLEFLIAADIIYMVAIKLTFETIGILATVILVRTFLSFTLEVELTGKWPWQHDRD